MAKSKDSPWKIYLIIEQNDDGVLYEKVIGAVNFESDAKIVIGHLERYKELYMTLKEIDGCWDLDKGPRPANLEVWRQFPDEKICGFTPWADKYIYREITLGLQVNQAFIWSPALDWRGKAEKALKESEMPAVREDKE